VHSTAGLADPGFEGQITLELSNVASLPIAIYPGMRIAQLVFERLTTPADAPYGHDRLGSKYQGQSGPTASEYWRNFSSE
jgi:dCTP deaminase